MTFRKRTSNVATVHFQNIPDATESECGVAVAESREKFSSEGENKLSNIENAHGPELNLKPANDCMDISEIQSEQVIEHTTPDQDTEDIKNEQVIRKTEECYRRFLELAMITSEQGLCALALVEDDGETPFDFKQFNSIEMNREVFEKALEKSKALYKAEQLMISKRQLAFCTKLPDSKMGRMRSTQLKNYSRRTPLETEMIQKNFPALLTRKNSTFCSYLRYLGIPIELWSPRGLENESSIRNIDNLIDWLKDRDTIKKASIVQYISDINNIFSKCNIPKFTIEDKAKIRASFQAFSDNATKVDFKPQSTSFIDIHNSSIVSENLNQTKSVSILSRNSLSEANSDFSAETQTTPSSKRNSQVQVSDENKPEVTQSLQLTNNAPFPLHESHMINSRIWMEQMKWNAAQKNYQRFILPASHPLQPLSTSQFLHDQDPSSTIRFNPKSLTHIFVAYVRTFTNPVIPIIGHTGLNEFRKSDLDQNKERLRDINNIISFFKARKLKENTAHTYTCYFQRAFKFLEWKLLEKHESSSLRRAHV